MLAYDSISKAINARHLMTPMDRAIAVPIDVRTSEALGILAPYSFDQAPVTAEGVVVGLVTRAALESADPLQPLPVERLASRFLIGADAPVAVVLVRLMTSPIVFVVEDTGLVGFLTASDVNKHPARTHFYLLLADLEMTIAGVTRNHLETVDDAVLLLSKRRQKAIVRRHASNTAFNVDADVLTAFEFADLLTVVRKLRLHGMFGIQTVRTWGSAAWELAGFRNDVMHPTREFLGERSIADLIRLERLLRDMLAAVRGEAAA